MRNERDEFKAKLEETKDFYESALEERFAQMEAFEQECEQLRAQLLQQEEAAGEDLEHRM